LVFGLARFLETGWIFAHFPKMKRCHSFLLLRFWHVGDRGASATCLDLPEGQLAEAADRFLAVECDDCFDWRMSISNACTESGRYRLSPGLNARSRKCRALRSTKEPHDIDIMTTRQIHMQRHKYLMLMSTSKEKISEDAGFACGISGYLRSISRSLRVKKLKLRAPQTLRWK
jgi:hypothetical protein